MSLDQSLLEEIFQVSEQTGLLVLNQYKRGAANAIETEPGIIEVDVNTIKTLVTTIASNTAQLLLDIATIAAQIASSESAILTAVGLAQQTGSPVTLPGTYPGGWSTQIASDSATGVWTEPDVVTGANALGDLSNIAVVVSNKGTNQLQPALGGRPFAWQGNVFQTSPFPLGISLPPDIPIGLATPADNLKDFLNAQNPGWTWDWDDADNTWVASVDPIDGGVTWFCTMSAQQFNELVAVSGSASAAPPIWPGLAGVTLGTAVALTDGLVVAGPLAGIIVTITAVAPPMSFYPFGTIKSYVRAGAVIFTDDNGDSEFPQPLGPADQLMLCKSMAVADTATFRVTSGVVGTAQPFTIP